MSASQNSLISGLGTASSIVVGDDVTVSNLYSVYPPSNYTKKYVWVSDLFGGNGDFCLSDGAYWKPVRPLAYASMATGNMALQALTNAPTCSFTGAVGLGVTNTITFSTINAYPGAVFRVIRKVTGLGSLLVNGVGLSLNSWADMEFDGSTWVQTASGGLL